VKRDGAARIVCVGNALAAEDDIGPRAFARLGARALPDGVELVDGGLRGLDLVREVEGARRVVFVDTVEGEDAEVAVLSSAQVVSDAPMSFGHEAGLPFLLRALPHLVEGPVPEAWVVGAGPGAGEETLARLVDAALQLAAEGTQPGGVGP